MADNYTVGATRSDKPTNTPSSTSALIATKFTTTAIRSKTNRHESPQKGISDFWSAFHARKPGRITSIFPRRLYEQWGLQPAQDVVGWTAATVAGVADVSTPAASSSSSTSSTSSVSSWAAVSAPSTPAEPSPTPTTSYEAAAAACRAAVARIVSACHRTNEKFTDPEFNLEDDPNQNCLRGLVRRRAADGGEENALHPLHTPPAVHRVDWIFEKPVFVKNGRERSEDTSERSEDRKTSERSEDRKTSERSEDRKTSERSEDRKTSERSEDRKTSERSEDRKTSERSEDSGFSSSDVQQGRVGDCWWIAAVATMAHRTDLMRRVCVARDERCGVYGFVFVRDGAWTPVVVDDQLYVHHADFRAETYDASGQRARDHRQRFQRGSEALSFARCADANETWLPLLEKAFAKAHGDYGALAGGWCSEGMEDLTGGVSTTIPASRVLDKDRLWRELAGEAGGIGDDGGGRNSDFVFGLSVMGCGCAGANHNGLAVNHCYSVLRAVEAPSEDGAATVRLVQIRNPWGHRHEATHMGAWHGPWADGAKEWTPYWLKTLGHTFGDDGVFWMAFEDVLATFGYLHRTRLLDDAWTAAAPLWTSLRVGWVAGYADTTFAVDVEAAGLVVVVLSQLDDRYYRGLRGQYTFTLRFVLQSADGTVLASAHAPNAQETRSVSCEVVLPAAGRYTVRPHITARRDRRRLAEAAVVRMTAETNPAKLRQVGQQYDAAHAKGGDVVDEDQRLEDRRVRNVARVRARRAWHKAELTRLRAARVAWVAAREEFRLRREKQMHDVAVKETEKDDRVDQDKDKDSKDGEDSKDVKDGKALPDVDPGPEPVAFPEPSFSDSELDADDSDDILDDSDGEIVAIDLRKTMGKKGWPFVEGDDRGGDKNDKSDKQSDDDSHADDDDSPWNAVCIVGLRVYAKEPGVSVGLVKPEKTTVGGTNTDMR
ncbi:hypothetical protein SPBR_04081 [Sporothrix brasiliensis 5110]|uniref:Calpain catalytic domain-containing protein n=1 Tax=Sporothrix brasiliensis 5110 TaxID=1398154 RepID=A0A0C2J9A9_9PEZI|nr:uncharacterized protein SPBR_04081 [Sporothrix brasiliensis 5110]KIH93552.1 hypothetical protein SPBR_04081 [Sporothrix brasiliensis 5110]